MCRKKVYIPPGIIAAITANDAHPVWDILPVYGRFSGDSDFNGNDSDDQRSFSVIHNTIVCHYAMNYCEIC